VRAAGRFNAGAAVYDEIWAPVLLPHGRALVAGLPLANAARILEIAAGVGRLLPVLRAAAPQATIFGVDVSHGMLSRAAREFPIAVMDAAHLALADESFDAAIMAFALFLVPEPAAALAEAYRILRKGGCFALSSWEGVPHFPAQDIWSAEARAAGAPIVPWEPDTIDPDALRRLLTRAGFRDVNIDFRPFDHRHDPASFLRFRMALATPWLDSLPGDDRAALLARIQSRLDALDPDGYLDPTRILVAYARR
jgi:SAM-dependent methyltransferase